MLETLWILPLLVLVAATLTLAFGKWLPLKGAFLGVAATGWSLLHSSVVLVQALTGKVDLKEPYEASINWFRFGTHDMSLGLYVDGMTVFLLFVVTLVAFLVHLYSIGYMHGDARFKRFYFYLGLFTFSMLGLTVADNILQFFACWEVMGACSYLLIGFWFEKPEAAEASKKAFITTKLGDIGMFLGILLIFASMGTFRFTQIEGHIAQGLVGTGTLTVIGLLLFCGSVGKSAQVPLFVWLPDAMQGPTPVSALIHAATMVAAGVYLVARMFFIFEAAPVALETVAWVGVMTAFMAATMAVVAFDLKQVLAWSTISQLGYMMLGLGVGSQMAGMFHLTTHAFFKALLFLGAGSVIHAVHTNDMREMGGLSKRMPITFLTMLVACLAIAGFPYSSGYFSKDLILLEAGNHHPGLFWIAWGTAGLTAFYMFRMFFMTFLGEPRNAERFSHAHESPAVMTAPLVVLAVLSAVAGFAFEHGFETLVGGGAHGHGGGDHAFTHGFVSKMATAGMVAAVGLAGWLYLAATHLPEKIRSACSALVEVLTERYGFDRFFLGLVELSDILALVLFWIDLEIVDRIFVDGWGWLTDRLARIKSWIDDFIVDGVVDGFGGVADLGGRALRVSMTGLVQNYILYLALGVVVFAWWVLRL